jgi:tetrahydromethanopterin S-methyltransferase subunit D
MKRLLTIALAVLVFQAATVRANIDGFEVVGIPIILLGVTDVFVTVSNAVDLNEGESSKGKGFLGAALGAGFATLGGAALLEDSSEGISAVILVGGAVSAAIGIAAIWRAESHRH